MKTSEMDVPAVPAELSEKVAELVEQAQYDGVQLTGEGGMLPDLIRQAVEAALQGELTAHLGYERYAAEGRGSGNSRNGSTSKTVQTAAGPAEVAVPRDRAGTFEPVTVPKGTRRFAEFDDMVIGLYAKGLTTRDIAEWLEQTYGTDISHETVANITDSVNDLVKEWRSRPLDEVYPIVYIDAIRIRVRDGGAVRIKACHIAVGVDLDGRKRVLGMWIEQTEGARFWAGVLTELRNRGVRDVLIVCCAVFRISFARGSRATSRRNATTSSLGLLKVWLTPDPYPVWCGRMEHHAQEVHG